MGFNGGGRITHRAAGFRTVCYALWIESTPDRLTCKQGPSALSERRTPFGSVTRNHYAAEHFLTRYSALIICLASAPETYGFIAKYARATNSARGKNLIPTSCSVLRSPKFRGTNGVAFEKTLDRLAAAPVNLSRQQYNISDGPRHRKRGTRANEQCLVQKDIQKHLYVIRSFIVLTVVVTPPISKHFITIDKIYFTRITFERSMDSRI